MRTDAYDIYTEDTSEYLSPEAAEASEAAKPAEAAPETEAHRKGLFGKRRDKNAVTDDAGQDLTKLKKTELLEIMLAQGREIDKLRERVAELEEQIEKREADFENIGSLAEATVYMSTLFKEADKVVETYMKNIRRKYE